MILPAIISFIVAVCIFVMGIYLEEIEISSIFALLFMGFGIAILNTNPNQKIEIKSNDESKSVVIRFDTTSYNLGFDDGYKKAKDECNLMIYGDSLNLETIK